MPLFCFNRRACFYLLVYDMLIELKIRDFAIIDDLTISFDGGMNILTGETGAGKSIIIDAVNLILGGRGSTDYIRTGCPEASIEALFDIGANDAAKNALRELGYRPAHELIIKRRLLATGKSKVIINDSFSTVNTLSRITPLIINVYGQNEHQELLNKEKHLDMLDEFAGVTTLTSVYKVTFSALQEVEEKLSDLKSAAENKDKEIGFIEYQLSEIAAAKIEAGEEDELIRGREIINNAQKILDTCSFGFEQLYQKAGSVNAILSEVLSRLESVKALDSSFENYHNEIKEAVYSLEDAAFFFRDYPKQVDFSGSSIDDIESRLNVISGMKKKYGGTVDSIFNTKIELERRLNELKSVTQSCEELEARRAKLFAQAQAEAKKLSVRRKKSAGAMTAKMERELKSLGMAHAGFFAKFAEKDEAALTDTGTDEVEFYFSANPGEDDKPLMKVASGGELSRIMLALKNITTSGEAPVTLIFDEVDAGIGGKTAHIVGAKLKALSSKDQVICITHLPQIASYSDSHYFVTKAQREGRTITKVVRLTDDERVCEVARLLSGEAVTDHSLRHAADMISKNVKEGEN